MDLINELSRSLGVDAQGATSAAGGVLGAIQQAAPAGALDGLLSAVPEAGAWLKAAGVGNDAPAADSPAPVSLGGVLGGLASAFGGAQSGGGGLLSALAGAAQGAAAAHALVSAAEKLGVPAGVAAKAVPIVLSFIQSKLGADGFAKLAAQVPLLKGIAS